MIEPEKSRRYPQPSLRMHFIGIASEAPPLLFPNLHGDRRLSCEHSIKVGLPKSTTERQHCESAPGADDDYRSVSCECTGACGCALACGDGSVGTGLRIGVAIGRSGGVLGRRFCSEALAIKRDICSWLALSSATAALSRAICACATLSCS